LKLDIKKITEHVKTRTINQVRSHLQKHQIKLSKQNSILQQTSNYIENNNNHVSNEIN
jgi:hypothetical protein